MAERLMAHEASVRRRKVSYTEERRRRNQPDTPTPTPSRGNGAGASSSKTGEENEENLSGVTATVLLDSGEESEIAVECLSAEIVARTMDERQLTAPPPFEPPDEPEREVEGPELPDNDADMTNAAAMRAAGEGEATDGPIDVDEYMDTLRARASLQAREELLKLEDSIKFYNRVGDTMKPRKLYEELQKVVTFITD